VFHNVQREFTKSGMAGTRAFAKPGMTGVRVIAKAGMTVLSTKFFLVAPAPFVIE